MGARELDEKELERLENEMQELIQIITETENNLNTLKLKKISMSDKIQDFRRALNTQ